MENDFITYGNLVCGIIVLVFVMIITPSNNLKSKIVFKILPICLSAFLVFGALQQLGYIVKL